MEACIDGKEVVAMVLDSCPTCHQYGDLDLSSGAWNDVTGNDAYSRYDGSFEWVPCPDEFLSGNVSKLRFKSGSSRWWNAVQDRPNYYHIRM